MNSKQDFSFQLSSYFMTIFDLILSVYMEYFLILIYYHSLLVTAKIYNDDQGGIFCVRLILIKIFLYIYINIVCSRVFERLLLIPYLVISLMAFTVNMLQHYTVLFCNFPSGEWTKKLQQQKHPPAKSAGYQLLFVWDL